MKSDVIKIEKIDITKTRWPGLETKQFFLEAPVSEKALHTYPSLGISVDHPQYPNRFFKRDTAKNNILTEVDIVTDKSFLLENLIENLIESSFGPLQNDTELDLSVNVDYYNDTPTTIEPITIPPKRNLVPKMIIINETTNVVSIRNTDENIDNNKYTGVEKEDDTYKNVFNEMITKLSKHIDNQNNHSMELMEQLLGHNFIDAMTSEETTEGQITATRHTMETSGTIDDAESLEPTEANFNNSNNDEPQTINNNVNKTLDKININSNKNILANQTKATFTNNTNSNNYDNKINDHTKNTNINNYNNNFQRKSRQRFVRKFQNSKKSITMV